MYGLVWSLRGGVIIKRTENLGTMSKIEGGSKNKQKCLKFKFRHLKTHGGGFNFSKMSLKPNPKKEKEKNLICPFSM